MYSLDTPLPAVTGIGDKLSAELNELGLTTVRDLILWLPLRYEDRSTRKTIDELVPDELVTIQVQVDSTSQFRKGKRTFQKAKVSDETGNLELMWFNNRFIINQLKSSKEWLVSGKLGKNNTMLQPRVEKMSADTIHTDRLVPVYSKLGSIKPGMVRRVLKEISDHLQPITQPDQLSSQLPTLEKSLAQLHFPDGEEQIRQARQRLALEELLSLIETSHQLKQEWANRPAAPQINLVVPQVPPTIPFELTFAQAKAVKDTLHDITQPVAMNRLLIGDVGAGKTVVAAIAAWQLAQNGHHTAIVAPTQILATQHAETITKLLPDLPVRLITGQEKLSTNEKEQLAESKCTPTCFIGTHAVINQLDIINPGLVVYDEQHRFGVNQRSTVAENLQFSPHTLTMSATPIPRSLMLTIFSHLQLSVIDTLPPGRLPIKTWLIPPSKRADSWEWLASQLQIHKNLAEPSQALIVCPFINPSENDQFSHVSAATDLFDQAESFFGQHNLNVGLLHGKLPTKTKDEVTQQLFSGEIDILVTTPVIEVGLDVAAATYILIEGAERFGMASLHQMRGRVGRAGQQAYCILVPSKSEHRQSDRLQEFTQELNGLKLAELDLARRGGGDLFGTEQSGLDQLQFASWNNAELIAQAHQLYQQLESFTSPLLQPRKAKTTVAAN